MLLLFHYYARYNEMSNTGVDEAEREMEDLVLLQWLAALVENPPRGARWKHCCLEWDEHVEQLGEQERGRESKREGGRIRERARGERER